MNQYLLHLDKNRTRFLSEPLYGAYHFSNPRNYWAMIHIKCPVTMDLNIYPTVNIGGGL